MSLLPFTDLKPYKARAFVSPNADLGDWSAVEPLYAQLEARARELQTEGELRQWLLDWGELNAAIDEESSKRYIAMTCHTENPDAEKAFLHFVEEIEPKLKPWQFKLEQLYLACPLRSQLRGFEVFDQLTKIHVELFRQENVPLETEEAKLSQQYQKLSGSLTVQFRGEEKTLVQMGRYLEDPDRSLREEAWHLMAQRRLQERDKFEDIFDQLIKLREQIARNAGFSNYRDYAFKARGRLDYTAEDCHRFHDAIETHILPILRRLHAERVQQLQLPSLRPWDLAVDPLNRPALRPFEQVDTMVERTQKIFDKLDADLARGFKQMNDLRLLDLANRKGKAPGGYQSTLAEARLPFIFMNAVGVQRDVETILHEAGHAFHALATQRQDFYPYRSAPIEFCEVASMSMELLGNAHIEEFYDSADAKRARHDHLEGIIEIFPWIATVDAFQHWIYTHPGHTREERRAAWEGLMVRFGGDVDWRGYEEVQAYLWHRQLHIFIHPFYYIEYGIAQLGALQVWVNSSKNKAKALKDYQAALALGGSLPLPKLFEAAGCKFDFSAQTVEPLARMLERELEKTKS
ncbi:MAG TPA: M3 family oligoendopeptidase [Methylomirabilota bacterium]|nr:M3 family oligoendopeptidase [Methylomirabilota bacterium]